MILRVHMWGTPGTRIPLDISVSTGFEKIKQVTRKVQCMKENAKLSLPVISKTRTERVSLNSSAGN